MTNEKKELIVEPSITIYIKAQEIKEIKKYGSVSIGAYNITLVESRVTKK